MIRRNNAILFVFMILSLARNIGCSQTGSGHESPFSSSRDPVSSRSDSSTLRVATSGDYWPFSIWNSSTSGAEPSGFSTDIARAFARHEGLQIEWVRFRWATLLDDLVARRFDVAISGITVRPERSIAGRFSLPFATSGALVLVLDESSARTSHDLDRPGVRIAVNAGGHLERVAHKLFPRATIDAVRDNQRVLVPLLQGQVIGVVSDTLEAPHWQARAGGRRPLRRIGPLTQDRKAALFGKTESVLARHFDDWLLEAEAKGTLARLRRHHALPEEHGAEPVSALLASLDERLSLMTSVARVKAVLAQGVEDREREKQVLDSAWQSVERFARATDRPPPERNAVRRLFRAQIEAAKWIQNEALQRRGGKPDPTDETFESISASRVLARRELDQAIRPALIRLGDRIARLVARLPRGETRRLEFAETARALARHGLPDSHLHALHEALVSLLRSAT